MVTAFDLRFTTLPLSQVCGVFVGLIGSAKYVSQLGKTVCIHSSWRSKTQIFSKTKQSNAQIFLIVFCNGNRSLAEVECWERGQYQA